MKKGRLNYKEDPDLGEYHFFAIDDIYSGLTIKFIPIIFHKLAYVPNFISRIN
jgi:hypothetical protein